MPGKNVQCRSCLKIMRSDNLKRHARSCSGISTTVSGKWSVDETPHYEVSSVKQKRQEIPNLVERWNLEVCQWTFSLLNDLILFPHFKLCFEAAERICLPIPSLLF